MFKLTHYIIFHLSCSLFRRVGEVVKQHTKNLANHNPISYLSFSLLWRVGEVNSFRILYFIALFLLAVNNNYGQSEAEQFEESVIESIYESLTDEFYDFEEIETIEYYMNNPLNLYTVSPRRLANLPGIDYRTAREIIRLSRRNPQLRARHIADSLFLSGETELLLQYCTYIQVDKKKKSSLVYRSRTKHRFEEVYGFSADRFEGSPIDLYQRAIYKDSRISAGLLTKKSAGEQSIAEYYSGYASVDLSGFRFIAGDYSVSYGQGLLAGKPFAPYKGQQTISPAVVRSSGIQPYRSTLDYLHYRGAAVSHFAKLSENFGISLVGAYSNNDKSATVDEETALVSSIYTSNLYRTKNDISKKNALNEQIIFGNSEIWLYDFKLGGNIMKIDYDKEIQASSSRVFQGKSGIAHSIYGNFNKDGLNFAGEYATDNNQNTAYSLAFSKVTPQVRIAGNFRHFDSEYRGFYANTFNNFSYVANETGFYTGLEYRAGQKLKISAYSDIYRSNSSTYSSYFPVRGIDFFVHSEYRHSRESRWQFRLGRYAQTYSERGDIGINNVERTRYNIRVENRTELSRTSYIRFRAEQVLIDTRSELRGSLIFAETGFNIFNSLQFSTRLTVFSTDDYASAVRQFEYIAPGYSINQPLYGDGFRGLFRLRWTPHSSIALHLRYSYMQRNNTDQLGSSYDAIQGNRDRRAVLQLDVRL